MRIPWNWVDYEAKYEDARAKMNCEPRHSGKLTFWRRVRYVIRVLRGYISTEIDNEKKNFAPDNSTVRTTLDFIGDEFDKLIARVTTLENKVSALESDVATLKSNMSSVQGDISSLNGRVAKLESNG